MAESAFVIRGVAYTLPITFYDSLGRVVVSPPLAAGDIKVMLDGGASANIATLPTETPASSGRVPFVFSTGETTCDELYVICKDQSATKEWMDFAFYLFPVARQLKDLAYPAVSGRSLAVDVNGGISLGAILGTALTETAGQIAAAFTKFFNKSAPTGTVNSIPDAVAGASGGIAIVGSQMDLVNAPNATAITAFQSGLATSAALTTLQGNVTTILGDYARRTGDYATPAALATLQGNVTTILSDYARRTGDYATVASITTLQANVTTILADYARRTGDYATPAALATLQGNVSTILADYARRTGDYATVANVGTVASMIAALNNLSAAQVNAEIVSVKSTRIIPNVISADGTRPTEEQALLMILRWILERSVSGVTETVYEEDGVTPSFTSTLDSATTPTSRTRVT